jgi:peptidoglycan/xylan/chitin deacetylase (PgdA/CDA1 family)
MPPARLALYSATAGVLAMTGYALWAHPPPLEWALLALGVYAALLFSGVLVLRLRVFVDALVRGPAGARGVALTFDDGPHPLWTPHVLDVLAKHRAVATFFVVGRKVDEHPEVLRAILDAGHTVGLHSYAHDRLFALRGEARVRADLERGVSAIAKVTGERPRLFRPPIGHTNPTIARAAYALDLAVIGWSVRGRDALAGAEPRDVVSRVKRGLNDGAIVLLHDAPEKGDREPAALKALPEILEAIEAARLEVVSLEAFLDPPLPRRHGGA